MKKVKKLIVKGKWKIYKLEELARRRSETEKVDGTHWTFRCKPYRRRHGENGEKIIFVPNSFESEKILQINPCNSRIPFFTNRKHFYRARFRAGVTIVAQNCEEFDERFVVTEAIERSRETSSWYHKWKIFHGERKSVETSAINIKFNDLLRQLRAKVMRWACDARREKVEMEN